MSLRPRTRRGGPAAAVALAAAAALVLTACGSAQDDKAENQQVEDLAVEISPERMDEAAADWIFTGVYGAKDKTKRDSAEDNPVEGPGGR